MILTRSKIRHFNNKKLNNFNIYKEGVKIFGPPAANQGPFPNRRRYARRLRRTVAEKIAENVAECGGDCVGTGRP